MNPRTTLRRATPADRERLWFVRTLAIAGINDGHYRRAQLNQWAAVPMPVQFDEVIRTQPLVVAETTGGAVVGMGFLDQTTGEVNAIFVHPEYQRRGIGTKILLELEQIARNSGLECLRLSATLNSVPFYKAAGYAELAESNYSHPNGFELRCVVMSKHLIEAPLER